MKLEEGRSGRGRLSEANGDGGSEGWAAGVDNSRRHGRSNGGQMGGCYTAADALGCGQAEHCGKEACESWRRRCQAVVSWGWRFKVLSQKAGPCRSGVTITSGKQLPVVAKHAKSQSLVCHHLANMRQDGSSSLNSRLLSLPNNTNAFRGCGTCSRRNRTNRNAAQHHLRIHSTHPRRSTQEAPRAASPAADPDMPRQSDP